MNKTICQISWTEQDLIDAFVEIYNRTPSPEELSLCIKSVPARQLEERSIELGWNFIYDAVRFSNMKESENVI